jgi:hypothetical protein
MVSRSFLRLHSFLTGRRPPRSITIMHPMPPKRLCIRTKPYPAPKFLKTPSYVSINPGKIRESSINLSLGTTTTSLSVSSGTARSPVLTTLHSRRRLPPEHQYSKVQRPATFPPSMTTSTMPRGEKHVAMISPGDVPIIWPESCWRRAMGSGGGMLVQWVEREMGLGLFLGQTCLSGG